MAWPSDWDRASVLGAIEEVTGVALSAGDSLPDMLIAQAQALGLQPVHLKTWIYDSPEHPFTGAALEDWARRYQMSSADATIARVETVPTPPERPRATKCPLYGHSLFVGPEGPVLVCLPGAESNRCPLVTNAHAPCRMEIEGQEPDWRTCPRNPENYEGRRRLSSLTTEASNVTH